MTLAPEMIDRLSWPAYALAARRVRLLRELLSDAVARSPWHRERFAGVDLDQLDEMSLRELPPMTKGRRAGIVEYQVRQTTGGAQIAVRRGAPVDLDELRGEIALALASLGLPRPVVEITAVERLHRDAGPAKLRRFVPLGDRRTLAPGGARLQPEPVLSATR
jgi:hypothetical protein